MQTSDAVGAAASQLGPNKGSALDPIRATAWSFETLTMFAVVYCCRRGSEISAHAAIAALNKEVGLTHDKLTRVMKILFGLRIGRATSCRSMLRTSKKCEPAYLQIVQEIRGSPLAKID